MIAGTRLTDVDDCRGEEKVPFSEAEGVVGSADRGITISGLGDAIGSGVSSKGNAIGL